MYRLVAFVLLLMAVPRVGAQAHFTFTAGTGNNATVVLPQSATPTIGGVLLEAGDEVAVATPAGLVVGAVVWPGLNGGNVALTVHGDDEVGTPTVIDGIREGEAMGFRVWDKSAAKEYGGAEVAVTYSSAQAFYRTDGRYSANGLFVLASLAVSVAAAPAAPALALPADGATGVSLSPSLSWAAVAGATGYNVQVAPTNSFATPTANQTLGTGTATTVSGLALQTTYYWRVRALNDVGTGAWSGVRSFTTTTVALAAPALAAPADGATGLAPAGLTLSWTPLAGALSYDVDVSRTEAFITYAASGRGITAASFAPASLVEGTTYYWRVRASSGAGAGPWSSTRRFSTTATAAPSAPVLSAPLDVNGLGLTPVLAWQVADQAYTYDVHISAHADFSSAAFLRQRLPGTTVDAAGLAYGTTYYWRVRASNPIGTGPWSASGHFTTKVLAAPSSPVMISPEDGADGVPLRVTLSWAPVEGAAGYDVQVADFGLLVADVSGLAGTSREVTVPRGRTTYYWRVRAVNAVGAGPWSASRSFTTSNTGVATEHAGTPVATALGRAYPNPARVRATIPYTLAAPSAVRLDVMDALGRVVARLVNEAAQPAGRYTAVLEAAGLVPGVYVCRMQAGSVVQTQRLVVTEDR